MKVPLTSSASVLSLTAAAAAAVAACGPLRNLRATRPTAALSTTLLFKNLLFSFTDTAAVTALNTSAFSFVIHPIQTQNSRIMSTSSELRGEADDNNNSNNNMMPVDPVYPGTAVQRLQSVHARIAQLVANDELTGGAWSDIRRKLLWAGGLRDLPNNVPGQGYTGHSFNDYNHVDCTCMLEQVSDNENDGRVVSQIARGNLLGPGIRIASIPELGPGGSWSTCANGCDLDPPQDVAHVQFQARIAFKLVWVPVPKWDRFVLVDDDGNLLAVGTPDANSGLPHKRERQRNYALVQGSKYAKEADKIAKAAMTAAE